MIDVFEKPSRVIEFARAYEGENVDCHALMQGYGSTVDAPTCDFYKEIHRTYPRAKLILTVRDSDEKWFDSFENTVGIVGDSGFYRYAVYPVRFLRLQLRMLRKAFQVWKDNYDIQPSMHSQHNQRMVEENPEGTMLVFNVKEGWQLLCQFLKLPVPKDVPFPNKNDAREFQRGTLIAKLLGLSAWTVVGASLGLSSYFLFRQVQLF